MIKSLLNGTDHCCVLNIQPTAVLQMHLLICLCIQPRLFRTEIRVKFSVNFDCVTHFVLAMYSSNVRKQSRGLCLEVMMVGNKECIGYSLLLHAFPFSFS